MHVNRALHVSFDGTLLSDTGSNVNYHPAPSTLPFTYVISCNIYKREREEKMDVDVGHVAEEQDYCMSKVKNG